MPMSSLARHIYGRKIISFNFGTLTNVPATTTDTLAFVCPVSGNLKNVKAAVLTGDGATSALTVQVKRGSTVLGSSGATSPAGTGAGVALSGNLTAPVSIDEPLVVSILAVNATDDFTGATVEIEFEHDFGDDGNI